MVYRCLSGSGKWKWSHRGRRTHGCPSWDIYVNSPSASLLHSNVPLALSLHRMYPGRAMLADHLHSFIGVGFSRDIFSTQVCNEAKNENTLWRELTELERIPHFDIISAGKKHYIGNSSSSNFELFLWVFVNFRPLHISTGQMGNWFVSPPLRLCLQQIEAECEMRPEREKSSFLLSSIRGANRADPKDSHWNDGMAVPQTKISKANLLFFHVCVLYHYKSTHDYLMTSI